MASHKFQKVSRTILDLYSQGYTKVQIAEGLGMKDSQVTYVLYTLLKVHEDQPRKSCGTSLVESMPKDQVNRIITLASWGYNGKEIAEDTCLPYNRIQLVIKEATQKNLIKKFV